MRRHRLFVVPTRPDLPVGEAIDHWEQHHGSIFAATPDLGGYVQHRPTRAEQDRLGGRLCAEAWFADRETEARAFGSDHYRRVVTVDEDRFIDRDRGWTATVLDESPTGPTPADSRGPLEVVAVGCAIDSLPAGTPARVLTLDRPGPASGPPLAVFASVEDEASGRRLAEELAADVVFVARRHPVIAPTA